MGQVSDTISGAARVSRAYAERLLVGINAQDAHRKPLAQPGLRIDTNHPTFVYGHLALYPAKALTLLGRDPGDVLPPPGWEELFKAGAPCRDDADSNLYPGFADVTTMFFRATDAAMSAVSKVDDAILAKPNPNEQFRDRFPTVGVLTNFYLNNHVMMHLGQVSAWRRCMGLPAAM